MSICLSIRPNGKARLSLGGFSPNFMSVFRKPVLKIQPSLKSNKNNQYFTRRPMYIYDNISLSSSQNEKYFGQNL